MDKTLFERIIAREIPADIVYETDDVLAFKDINPQAPVHILVIPRIEIPRLMDMKEADKGLVGHLMYVAQKVAVDQGLESGFRIVINNGPDACQSVYHLHAHVMGGRGFSWPPG